MHEARGARSEAARAEMVARQLRGRGIADERVLAAMGELPREAFIADARRDYAYVDGALPIAAGQTISQPYVVARMTELLRPKPGDRVLEIGTGSGYQAAVLAKLGANVVSFERQPELAASARENLERLGLSEWVDVRLGDGSAGDPEGGQYDGIIVTAAAPRVPERLLEQLKDGGRLVIPVGPRDHQDLLVVERHGNEWSERSDGPVVFVPLVGQGGYPD
jgi:protein-L-isoaspartate(D-aspartate) O-methyltransferase